MNKQITSNHHTKNHCNHHTNYNYKDYQKYIKNVSWNFSEKSNVDIDEFISEAGLVWVICMEDHDVEKCSFIAFFKIRFKYACIRLMTKKYAMKRGGKTYELSLDQSISDDNNGTLHDFISETNLQSTNYSDLCLLSSPAKQIIKILSEYKELADISNRQRKMQITKNNTRIKNIVGQKNYKKGINEICGLLQNSRPAKQLNSFPVAFKTPIKINKNSC